MPALTKIESFFKPEIRKSGEDLVADETVTLSTASDTAVRAYAKGLTLIRVTLQSRAITAPSFTAECTCSAGKKGSLCKHEWAAILLAEKKHPDFFEGKTMVIAGEPAAEASPQKQEQQTAMRDRQAAYRKVQYEKQKARAKELKGKASRPSKSAPALDPDVAAALAYFEQNGFPFQWPVDEDELSNARKTLARVFHPDKGGSHDEIVELNRNFDVLKS